MARKQTATLTAKNSEIQQESNTHGQALDQLVQNKQTQPPSTTVSEEAIRHAAYELYEARHGENGSAEDDWLQAEARIMQLPF